MTGRVNLVGPSTTPGAPKIGTAAVNAAVNAAILPQIISGNDIIPKFHLTNLSGGGAKVVDIIGDSTGTEIMGQVDPSQTIWDALECEMQRRNPDCTFTFNNRAIGGANWSHPVMTGTATGLALPSWFVTPGNIWLSYVQTDAPDVLFVLLGTNAASAGSVVGGGNSVATYISQFLTVINGWTKKPNIIFITNKVANPAAGGQYLVDQDNYKAMASFQRTFARTNGKGYTAFPLLPYFGLIDIGRHYVSRTEGYDPAIQYLQANAAYLATGLTIPPPASPALALATTTAGDFRMTLVFPGAGNAVLFGIAGGNGFYITCSAFVGNRIQVSLNGAGLWVTRYELDGSIAAPAQAGATITPGAGDVTMLITCKSEIVQVSINGTMVLNTRAPRLISKHNITIGFASAPTGSQTVNVTEFYEGIGAPRAEVLDPAVVYGAPGGPQGGNGINHPGSYGNTLDWDVISAANLTAP